MKKISRIIIYLFLSTFSFVGCSDLLDVDSDRLVFADEYNMSGANDTLYSMFGIFSQLQKLSDSYVLLGELRGELMETTDKSDMYLKEINNFNISEKNPYANNLKDYYAVINNCNYVIHNIDTTVMKGGVKVMLKEYAACKAIRAWTYMQIAMNFGSVTYYERPILSVKDANLTYPEYTMEQLAPVLIADLTPWKDVEKPNFGSLYTHQTSLSFFPIRFLLGDLYLWKGSYTNDPADYEKAAGEYRDLMYTNSYVVSSNFRSTRQVVNNAFTGNYSIDWVYSFISNNGLITAIASTNEFGTKYELDSLTENSEVMASKVAIDNWDKTHYFHSYTLDTLGDLRKFGSVNVNSAFSSIDDNGKTYITKYMMINPTARDKKVERLIIPYRVALLYLRYAEAVNRVGKPNLAMAVLKNGLNRTTMTNRMIIPEHEIETPLPNYMNFTDQRFDQNIGIHMRGAGNVQLDTVNFIIPAKDALQDSILYVEDMIQKELALETAFEGNRFHDLMRMAIRRNDNYYLADIVAAKHAENQESVRNKLGANRNYWYLKK